MLFFTVRKWILISYTLQTRHAPPELRFMANAKSFQHHFKQNQLLCRKFNINS